MRRYSAARVHLADMKQVCRAFDVTLNDVALAAITNSYRTILLDRGEKPGPNSVRTLVAVSVRSVNDFGVTDNRVSAMLPLCRSTSPTRSSSWRWCTPAHKSQRQWSTGRGQCPVLGGQNRSVCVLGVDDSADDPAAAKVGDCGGDQRSGPPEAPAGDGPAGVGSPADTADRSSSAHRDRDGQLRRQFLFLASPPTMTPHQTSTNSPTASRTG